MSSQIDWGRIPPLTRQAQAERRLGLVPRQTRRGIQDGTQLVTTGQFAIFGCQAAGEVFQLIAPRQFVFDHHDLFLQLGWDRHDRRQYDDERAVLLTGHDLPGHGLDDLRRLHEAMEVDQHEDGRSVRGGQTVDGADRRQGISGTGIGIGIVAGAGDL